jgi:hypothetical protein
MSTLTQDKVATVVQEFLNKNQPSSYRLDVDRAGIRQNNDWWYVTVVPDQPGVRAYDYAYLLTEAEEKLRDETHMNILLVPTLVDD